MHDINPQGCKAINYICRDEVAPIQGKYAEILQPNQLLMEHMLSKNNMRLILFSLWDGTVVPYFLLWAKPADLDKIDLKIKANRVEDVDFMDSISTSYQQTYCRHCSKSFPSQVIDGEIIYHAIPSLFQKKLELFKILTCPNCASFTGSLVVRCF